ncbi:MAG: ABC transporter permease [Cytophagales bacterium]|nr:ABC transporter permease [Cytophagales bacterium]MCA6384693.1 ABC transporter permease [Cytophagales bacterium]
MMNAIKLFLRSIKRSKASFIINLIGLSSGLACTFLIYLWVTDEMSVDKFHVKDNQLCEVMVWYQISGTQVTTPITPGPLAEALGKSIPDVAKSVAVLKSIRINTISSENKAFKANGIYTAKEFFDMFSFDVLQGNKEHLLPNESSIVISKDLALKLFGTTDNVVGKSLAFDQKEQFMVSAVVENVSAHSTIKFDFVLHHQLFERHTGIEFSWNESMASTYILMNDQSNIDQLNAQMLNWLEKEGEDIKKMKLFARKFSDGYLYGNYENGVQSGGRIEYVKIFTIIGIIILSIACINFISLSTAMASNRMKEVGMKKVLGAKRPLIIIQHLGESTILAFLSLFAALGLIALLLPAFNELADKHIALSWSIRIVVTFLVVTVLTGVLAGLYPAFYISRFEPGIILKDNLSNSLGGQWIRKGLVTTQFTVSVVLILLTLVLYSQFSLIQNRNLGYNKDGIVYFDMDGNVNEHREAFLSELKKKSGVQQASSIYALTTRSSFFGSDGSTGHLNWPGKDPNESINMNYRIVDYDMMELLGMEIKDGRSFSKEFSTQIREIIFNESAIKAMALKENPIGIEIELWQMKYKIIGIVKDFYFESIHAGKVKPMFLIQDPSRLNTVMVKVNTAGLDGTISGIEKFHNQFNPGYPFVYKFLDQDFQNLYATEKRISVLSHYFSGLAILISCLGLYGLTAFTVNKRKKEISTRKVLGASAFEITMLLYKDVSKLVLVSLIIGLPTGYFLANNWLEGFAERINLEPWFFIAAALLSITLMLIASGVQVVRALSINPAESLRTE